MRTFVSLVVAASLCGAFARALPPQDGKNDDEVARTPVDPYTGGDVAVLKASGAIGYGPFPWADGTRTEDIDRVLGNGRVLWLETEHFRIGCNLGAMKLPEAPGSGAVSTSKFTAAQVLPAGWRLPPRPVSALPVLRWDWRRARPG